MWTNKKIDILLISAGVLYLKIMRKWNIKVQQLEKKQHIHAHFKNSCNPEKKTAKLTEFGKARVNFSQIVYCLLYLCTADSLFIVGDGLS